MEGLLNEVAMFVFAEIAVSANACAIVLLELPDQTVLVTPKVGPLLVQSLPDTHINAATPLFVSVTSMLVVTVFAPAASTPKPIVVGLSDISHPDMTVINEFPDVSVCGEYAESAAV